MPGTLTELPAIEIPGHTSSGLGSDTHPMRVMTRRAAGFLAIRAGVRFGVTS